MNLYSYDSWADVGYGLEYDSRVSVPPIYDDWNSCIDSMDYECCVFGSDGKTTIRFEGAEFRQFLNQPDGNSVQYEDVWEEVEELASGVGIAQTERSREEVGEQVLEFINAFADLQLKISDPLVDEGLDSLSLALLSNKLKDEFHVDVPMADFPKYDSVQDLADHIFQRQRVPDPGRPRSKRKVKRMLLQPEAVENPVKTQISGQTPVLQCGDRVRLTGLSSCNQVFEGVLGCTVVFHKAENRWQVRLDGERVCKLIKEVNLELVRLEESRKGLKIIRACTDAGHIYLVHSLIDDLMSTPTALDAFSSVGHVCAIVYDDEAMDCQTLSDLASLYKFRVLDEFLAKRGELHGPLTIAAFSFGCAVANEMALQLDREGVEVNLVFYGLDMLRPAVGVFAKEGRQWFGGQLEAILLVARLAGAKDWAHCEEVRFLSSTAADIDAEEVAMRAFWDVIAPLGITTAASFSTVVNRLGSRLNGLRSLETDSKTDEIFQGPISLILSTAATESAMDDLLAMQWDRASLEAR